MTTTKSILKSIFDVKELSFFSLYCFFFYWTADEGLQRDSNSFFTYSLFFVSLYIYICLLMALLPHFTFTRYSLSHSSPFVLYKVLMGFLFVLQTEMLFHQDRSECATLCVYFSREKMLSAYVFDFVRLHWSIDTFSLPGPTEVVDYMLKAQMLSLMLNETDVQRLNMETSSTVNIVTKVRVRDYALTALGVCRHEG